MALAPPSLIDEKRTLRLTMRERRRALSADERAQRSHQAAARLLALPEVVGAATVAGFVALTDEIDPAPALAALERRGAVVTLPRVSGEVPRLRFHRAAGPLRPGPFGILEPDRAAPELAVEAIDLFLVPGLAFDGEGRRLGYGGGYYDEIAAGARLRIGLGFDLQVVDRCPAGEGDAAVHLVVTDARVIRCREMP
jgi:5-formyltetrahydrofolate cyclo-ligase